jgi:uncharacterized protein (DUF1697 family)
LEAPKEWKSGTQIRRYMAFVKEPATSKELLDEVILKEGVDDAKVGDGVLYMSTLLSGITKSGFNKLIGTKIYKNITIRNYTTVQKILDKVI